MIKTKQAPGLIAYRTANEKPFNLFRPRILFYGFILLFLMSGFVYSISTRGEIACTLLRALDAPYFELADGENQKWIANAYRLRVHNETANSKEIKLVFLPSNLPPDAKFEFPTETLKLGAGESRVIPFMVKIPKIFSQKDLKIKVQINSEIMEADFVSPPL
jgi:polyferredoxin